MSRNAGKANHAWFLAVFDDSLPGKINPLIKKPKTTNQLCE